MLQYKFNLEGDEYIMWFLLMPSFEQLWILTWLVPAILVFQMLLILGDPPRTRAAPRGIVSFELAGTATSASAILESWGGRRILLAKITTICDWIVIIPLYSTLIGLACVLVAQVPGEWSRWTGRLGLLLAWSITFAAVLDVFENVAIWKMLRQPVTDPWPQISKWCAIPKFAFIVVALTYVVLGWIVWMTS